MDSIDRPDDRPAEPWSRWLALGLWSKSALGFGLVSLATSLWSVFNGDHDPRSLSASVQIVEAATAIGRLTPYVVLLAVLVEPVRFRRWAFTAFVIWTIATGCLAIANVQDAAAIFRYVD
jgi:hypothetical protein